MEEEIVKLTLNVWIILAVGLRESKSSRTGNTLFLLISLQGKLFHNFILSEFLENSQVINCFPLSSGELP